MSAKPSLGEEPECVPSPNCFIAGEALNALRNDMRDIKVAIQGNPEMGQAGLVPRITVVENKVENHDRKLLVWGALLTAAGTIAGSLLAAAKDLLK